MQGRARAGVWEMMDVRTRGKNDEWMDDGGPLCFWFFFSQLPSLILLGSTDGKEGLTLLWGVNGRWRGHEGCWFNLVALNRSIAWYAAPIRRPESFPSSLPRAFITISIIQGGHDAVTYLQRFPDCSPQTQMYKQ